MLLLCPRRERVPAPLPLSTARRDGRHQPDKLPQVSLAPSLGAGASQLLFVARGVHPFDAAPDADAEALLRGVDTATIGAPPDRRALGLVPARFPRVELRMPAQRGAGGPLDRAVRDLAVPAPRPARRELVDNRLEALVGTAHPRREVDETVIVASRHELELLLVTALLTRPEFAHRPATDARRDGDTVRRRHSSTVER